MRRAGANDRHEVQPWSESEEIAWVAEQWKAKRAGATTEFLKENDAIEERLRAGDEESVFEALRLLGTNALWGDDVSDASGARIRRFVRTAIECWYEEARAGGRSERRSPQAKLRRLGKILAGSSRGRGDREFHDRFEIWNYYHQVLFRVTRALGLLRGQRRRNHDEQLQCLREVAKACRIPSDTLLLAAGLSSKGKVLRKVGSGAKDAARILTAKAFSITAPRAQNILSEAVREPFSLAVSTSRIRVVPGQAAELAPISHSSPGSAVKAATNSRKSGRNAVTK